MNKKLPYIWQYVEDKALADLSIEVLGESDSKLLENIVKAFFEVLVGKKIKEDCFKEKVDKKINIKTDSLEKTVICLIDELIYFKDVEGILFPRAKIYRLDKKEHVYLAKLYGIKITDNLEVGVDIKALSYHNLKIEETSFGYKAILVFDV